MIEKSPEHSRKPLKSYASKVFQESSVGVIASLAHTESKRRRVYKVIVFLLCLTGFLYQSGRFLEVVFQYPTSVGIEITRPTKLNVPAFTFCDNNAVNRRIFCEKFPKRCEEPSESFCEKYTHYCGKNKTLIPKREFYSYRQQNLTEMTEFNTRKEDFIKHMGDIYEDITGPFRRLKDEFGSVSLCYSIYDRVDNSLPPPQVQKQKIVRRPVSRFEFRIAEDETFLPGNQPGVLFAIHSPYVAVNPFDVGIFMRPGRSYMIFLSIEEELMQPKPYDTNCVNYSTMWEKNGKNGPRMQETCIRNCLHDLVVRCYDCEFTHLLMNTNERYCEDEDFEQTDKCSEEYSDDEANKCFHKCGDDCIRTTFKYTIQERFIPHFTPLGDEVQDLDNTIKADIFIEGDEIVVLKYSPKYMFVEVFSNIGGFIGCWLGINLLDITDVFDGFFRIIRYSIKKRQVST